MCERGNHPRCVSRPVIVVGCRVAGHSIQRLLNMHPARERGLLRHEPDCTYLRATRRHVLSVIVGGLSGQLARVLCRGMAGDERADERLVVGLAIVEKLLCRWLIELLEDVQ